MRRTNEEFLGVDYLMHMRSLHLQICFVDKYNSTSLLLLAGLSGVGVVVGLHKARKMWG